MSSSFQGGVPASMAAEHPSTASGRPQKPPSSCWLSQGASQNPRSLGTLQPATGGLQRQPSFCWPSQRVPQHPQLLETPQLPSGQPQRPPSSCWSSPGAPSVHGGRGHLLTEGAPAPKAIMVALATVRVAAEVKPSFVAAWGRLPGSQICPPPPLPPPCGDNFL